MIKTSSLLLLLFACPGTLFLSWQETTAGEVAIPDRPNLVFLYADDLGYGDLGCYGNETAKTPHLDQLADEGTRFNQFYVSHCVCSPTRASAITGQFPSRHRIYAHIATMKNNRARGMPHWLDVDAPSMPRALQQAGYRTSMIGKWHLGGGSGRIFHGATINHPDAPAVHEYGFDHVRTTFGNSPTWKNAEPWPEPHDIYPYEDKGWQRWSSKGVADEAIAFMQKHVKDHRDQPFYMNVWFKDPHTPFHPTPKMLKPFSHLPEPSRTHYAMIHFMDAQIGRVLKSIGDLGLRERTLVIFASDNGAVEGRGGSSGPLRAWKWYLYEGGIRVPLIVRWPGNSPTGRVDNASVMNIVDLTPTFCEIAGATMPVGYEPDGEDVSAAWRGQSYSRIRPMFWHHPTSGKRSPQLAVRYGKWKLLMDPDGGRLEMYDLDADIGEKNNVANDHSAVRDELRAMLVQWMATLP